jgi:hypothetical protein
MKKEKGRPVDFKLAMKNLAAIAELDLDDAPSLVIIDGKRILTNKDEISPDMQPWISGEGEEPIFKVLDLSYKAVHDHLAALYESGEIDQQELEGIASTIDLVGESARKIEKFLEYRMEAPLEMKVSNLKGFLTLHDLYEKIRSEEQFSNVDTSAVGLKDFETIRSDLEYELFYIRNEEGEPYFNQEMLRNIKLSCNFDLDADNFEEDPILQVRAMVDKDLHASAAQVLEDCHSFIADFFKVARNLEDNELAKSLSMAISALLLSTNSKNLMQNAAPKSSLQYFYDFFSFLRRALKTDEYQKFLAYPSEEDKATKFLVSLAHALCKSLFMRKGGVKLEAMGLIHRTMRKGEEIKQKKADRLLKGDTVWNQFLLDDEKFRTLLAKFPNGPLFKILDLVQEAVDKDTVTPFDPLAQDNIPSCIYQVEYGKKNIDVLRIPSPTRQHEINKAEVTPEFRGFLRALAEANKKHLLINLQDRNSWKEYARVRALEALQAHAEFNKQIAVVSLPKNTEFYYQSGPYEKLDGAQNFTKALIEQLKNPQEHGYFFPSQISSSFLMEFAEKAVSLIHTHFFQGAKKLDRKSREDFIEIFYQFLILKCIETIQPTSMSFTCKDAIDTGAAAAAGFYGFIKLANEDFSKREEQDFLRWLLYAPALFIRERAILPERLIRTLSFLEQVDLSMSQSEKSIAKGFKVRHL